MAKGMDAVLEKANAARKKRPLLRKKGAGKPGVAIMIALGGPKKGPPARPMGGMEEEGDSEGPMAEIARLKAKIAQLKARLAEYEGEGEGEDEGEEMDEAYDEEED